MYLLENKRGRFFIACVTYFPFSSSHLFGKLRLIPLVSCEWLLWQPFIPVPSDCIWNMDLCCACFVFILVIFMFLSSEIINMYDNGIIILRDSTIHSEAFSFASEFKIIPRVFHYVITVDFFFASRKSWGY